MLGRTRVSIPMQTSAPESGLLATLGGIDLTALAVLLVFSVLGLFRGFVWQASRIATLVVSFAVAGAYGEVVAGKIRSWFADGADPTLPLYIAYFGVFLVVLVVLSIAVVLLEKLVQRTDLSFFDRIGGGLLGIGTGACVVLASLWVVLMFFGNGSVVEAARHSRAMAASQRALGLLGPTVPEPMREVFGVAGEASAAGGEKAR